MEFLVVAAVAALVYWKWDWIKAQVAKFRKAKDAE